MLTSHAKRKGCPERHSLSHTLADITNPSQHCTTRLTLALALSPAPHWHPPPKLGVSSHGSRLSQAKRNKEGPRGKNTLSLPDGPQLWPQAQLLALRV